jgi:nitroreductase
MNDVMKLMQEHSSVRSYSEKKISNELLEELIASGQSAASSSFIQAYSVIRVVDPVKRQIIANAAGGQSWIIDAPEFMVLCADMQRINYASLKNEEGELKGYTEHFIAATVDTALMAQNILLAAESTGLGGVFIGGIRNNPTIVAETLELPQHVFPAFGLCLGWPAHKNAVKPRMPVSVIMHQDSYNIDAVPADVDAYDEAFSAYYGSRGSNVKSSNWSAPTTRAIQGKRREHMLEFLQKRGFLKC